MTENFWEWFELFARRRLHVRADTFAKMFQYLDRFDRPVAIVETGCCRADPATDMAWQGDGCSTVMFEHYTDARNDGSFVTSIDISEDAVANASCAAPNAIIERGDSVEWLRARPAAIDGVQARTIDLLYLDSFDFDPNDPLPSARHHYAELLAAMPMIRPDTLIVVDDSPEKQTTPEVGGKGAMIAKHMTKCGAKLEFCQYQTGWTNVRPIENAIVSLPHSEMPDDQTLKKAPAHKQVRLKLPNVTLLMVGTGERELVNKAMAEDHEHVEFGGDFIEVESFGACWRNPPIETTHALVHDWTGWIIDPSMWSDEFLEYDYIGAPWRYFDRINVGAGTFSLRSARLMRYIYEHPEFALFNLHAEDDLLCRKYRPLIERAGFRWAPPDVAMRFAFGEWRPMNITHKHFGFSGTYNWPLVLDTEDLQDRTKIAKVSPDLNAEIVNLQLLGAALIRNAEDDPWTNEVIRSGAERVGDYVAKMVNMDRVALDQAQVRYHNAIRVTRDGDLPKGFALFETSKHQTREGRHLRRDFGMLPHWAGQSLKGKTILLWHEQGYGDTITMSRYFPAIEAEAVRVYYALPDPIAPLIEANSRDFFRWTGENVDYHCSIFSLPFIRNTTIDTIPQPCLKAPNERPLFMSSTTRIGLCWAGNPESGEDWTRSIDLKQFLAGISIDGWTNSGIDFHALTRYLRDGESEILDEARIYYSGDNPELYDGFGRLAKLVDAMDVVITTDSAHANLAASLGRPTWVLSRLIQADWRWGPSGMKSPWYPSVTVLRQQKPGDWSHPLARAREKLGQVMETERRAMAV